MILATVPRRALCTLSLTCMIATLLAVPLNRKRSEAASSHATGRAAGMPLSMTDCQDGVPDSLRPSAPAITRRHAGDRQAHGCGGGQCTRTTRHFALCSTLFETLPMMRPLKLPRPRLPRTIASTFRSSAAVTIAIAGGVQNR